MVLVPLGLPAGCVGGKSCSGGLPTRMGGLDGECQGRVCVLARVDRTLTGIWLSGLRRVGMRNGPHEHFILREISCGSLPLPPSHILRSVSKPLACIPQAPSKLLLLCSQWSSVLLWLFGGRGSVSCCPLALLKFGPPASQSQEGFLDVLWTHLPRTGLWLPWVPGVGSDHLAAPTYLRGFPPELWLPRRAPPLLSFAVSLRSSD